MSHAVMDEETAFAERRNLDVAITRAENVVALIRTSFKTDDYVMVKEMTRHLLSSADDMYARAAKLDVKADPRGEV